MSPFWSSRSSHSERARLPRVLQDRKRQALENCPWVHGSNMAPRSTRSDPIPGPQLISMPGTTPGDSGNPAADPHRPSRARAATYGKGGEEWACAGKRGGRPVRQERPSGPWAKVAHPVAASRECPDRGPPAVRGRQQRECSRHPGRRLLSVRPRLPLRRPRLVTGGRPAPSHTRVPNNDGPLERCSRREVEKCNYGSS